MTYIRNQDTEGIQTKYVGKKFIAIREEKNENEQQVNTENNIENDVTQNIDNDENKDNNNNSEDQQEQSENEEQKGAIREILKTKLSMGISNVVFEISRIATFCSVVSFIYLPITVLI